MWRGGFNPPARFLVPLAARARAGGRGRLAAAARLPRRRCSRLELWTGSRGRPSRRSCIATATARRRSSARGPAPSEWTRLLPGYVLSEPDRHRLAARLGGRARGGGRAGAAGGADRTATAVGSARRCAGRGRRRLDGLATAARAAATPSASSGGRPCAVPGWRPPARRRPRDWGPRPRVGTALRAAPASRRRRDRSAPAARPPARTAIGSTRRAARTTSRPGRSPAGPPRSAARGATSRPARSRLRGPGAPRDASRLRAGARLRRSRVRGGSAVSCSRRYGCERCQPWAVRRSNVPDAKAALTGDGRGDTLRALRRSTVGCVAVTRSPTLASRDARRRQLREDDREAVEACQHGEREAFDRLVERYQRDVYRLCYRYVNNHQDANDMAQEVFLKAYRAIGSFRGDSAFSTWLYRIAVNTCLNFRAARRPPQEELPEDLPDRGAGAGGAMHERGARRAQRARRGRAAAREAARDADPEDLSRPDARGGGAAILGSSVGTVKANLFHALANLRKLAGGGSAGRGGGTMCRGIDGSTLLDGEATSGVRRHVEACAACRERVDDGAAGAGARGEARRARAVAAVLGGVPAPGRTPGRRGAARALAPWLAPALAVAAAAADRRRRSSAPRHRKRRHRRRSTGPAGVVGAAAARGGLGLRGAAGAGADGRTIWRSAELARRRRVRCRISRTTRARRAGARRCDGELGAEGSLMARGALDRGRCSRWRRKPRRQRRRRAGRPRPAPRPRDEAFKMVDAYIVSNLQESLGSDATSSSSSCCRCVKRLQNDRRDAGPAPRGARWREMRRAARVGHRHRGARRRAVEEVKAVEAEERPRSGSDMDAIDAVADAGAAGEVPGARGRGRAQDPRADGRAARNARPRRGAARAVRNAKTAARRAGAAAAARGL